MRVQMTDRKNCYIITLRGGYMAVKRINVTVEPELYEEFYKYACKKGISISPFLQAKMREFIEEEKEFEEFKNAKKKGAL